MSDFTTVNINYNTGTDGTPTWTGTAIAFGGSAGANEFRWQLTGGTGGASTASANWPPIVRPGATQSVQQCWAFAADTTGLQVATYDGSRTFANVFRISFDAFGSPATAMQMSAFQDTADTTPTAGTQTAGATDGRNIINGHATDTSSTSYLKGNVYGSGFPAAGAQETPAAGNIGTTLAVTSGTAGSVSPAAASWLATWQSFQGWIQFVTAPSVAKVLTAFFWYFSLAMFIGPNMQTGNFVFTPVEISYTWT